MGSENVSVSEVKVGKIKTTDVLSRCPDAPYVSHMHTVIRGKMEIRIFSRASDFAPIHLTRR